HTRCLSDWSSDVCSSDLARKGISISVVVLSQALSSHSLRAAPEALGSVIKTLARSGKASVPAVVTAMINEALWEMAWIKARIARSEERRVGKGESTGWRA